VSLRVEKNIFCDIAALTGLAVLPLVQCLRSLQVVVFEGPSWLFYLGSVICATLSIPVIIRFISSAPLVEIDDSNVAFFVGFTRRKRLQIPLTSLVALSVDADRVEGQVLCLTFEFGALLAFRKVAVTPYLSIKNCEVKIHDFCIRGNLIEIESAWMDRKR
jgi:hypothetical protein